MAHLLTVFWNTGRHYTASGQRITASLTEDERIIFCDHDRGISGVLTKKSVVRGIEDLRIRATAAYFANEYQYDTTGEADKLPLNPDDLTHGGKPGYSSRTQTSN